MSSFNRFSSSRTIDAKMVWAYVELNTDLIRKAHLQGVPVLLDVPIGHQRDFLEITKREHEIYGAPYPLAFIDKWTAHCEKEYMAADWISAGSTFVKKTLVRRGISPDKILVNPYGVDGSSWRQCFSHRSSEIKTMVFVYTASLTLRKGIQYLVQAWKKANLTNAKLLIVGTGELPWDKICGSMPANISFLGRLAPVELQDLYSNAHVFVIPSLFEGLVRSGLEAMASGLPVIITEETGLTDYVTNGREGWIVKSADVEELADRLKWCRDNADSVVEAGVQAYQTGKRFEFSVYGANCARIAQDIIEGKNPNLLS